MNMIRLVLADDEKWVLRIIKDALSEMRTELCIVGEASNGLEALELCKKTHPDVLLTDIRMPGLGGMELIDKVNQVSPRTKSVIISGYSEFELAHQAIGLRAFDYLLKPVDESELEKTILRAEYCLNEEKKQEELASMRDEKLIKMKRQQLMHDIIHCRYKNQEEFDKIDREVKADFLNVELCVMVVTITDYDNSGRSSAMSELHMRHIDFDSILRGLLPPSIQCCSVLKNASITELVVFLTAPDQLNRITAEAAHSFLQALHKQYCLIAVAGLSGFARIHNQLSEIKQQLKRAYRSYDLNFMTNETISVYQESQLQVPDDIPLKIDEKLRQQLFFSIKMNQEERARQIADQMFDMIAEQARKLSAETVKHSVWLLINAIVSELGNENFEITDLYSGDEMSIYAHMETIRSFSKLRDYTKSVFIDLIEINRKNAEDQFEDCISIAKKYTMENFNSCISLDMIAKCVYLNPTYFSELFKKRTGMNYTEYVTKLRMDKARELLGDTSLKIYEISEQVGYSDTKYFAKLFKKNFNLTPKEFRIQSNNNQGRDAV